MESGLRCHEESPLSGKMKNLRQHREYQLLENENYSMFTLQQGLDNKAFQKEIPAYLCASSYITLSIHTPHPLLSHNSLHLLECAVLFQAFMP